MRFCPQAALVEAMTARREGVPSGRHPHRAPRDAPRSGATEPPPGARTPDGSSDPGARAVIRPPTPCRPQSLGGLQPMGGRFQPRRVLTTGSASAAVAAELPDLDAGARIHADRARLDDLDRPRERVRLDDAVAGND